MIGLGDVSSALGGSPSTSSSSAPTPKPGDPVYVRGQHIDQENAEVGGATCPNLINDRDTHPQIEFIHFGRVHTSYGNRFPHDSYKDNEIVRPAPGKEKSRPPVPIARPRAIQFRSALEREAILLTVFIESAQTVFADGEGLLGSLMGAVGALLGSSGGVSSVKSSEMNTALQKTIAAAGTINVASIQYHDTHKAGRDFNEARNDYRKLLYKVTGHVKAPKKPVADTSGDSSSKGPTSPAQKSALDHVKAAKNAVQNAVSSAASSATSGAKAMMDIISFSQSALMKKTDIKTMCFALLAAQQERKIEDVCHDMSLSAITGSTAAPKPPEPADDDDAPASSGDDDDAPAPSVARSVGNPFLPIWHAIKDPAAAKPVSNLTPQERLQKGVTSFTGATVESVRGSLENKALDAVFGVSFLEYKKEGVAPGADAVTGSFGVPDRSPNPADSEPMEIGELFCLGFSKVTGKTTLPDFARGLILTISQDVAGFLSAIYRALAERPSDKEITKASLVMASKTVPYVSDVQSQTSQRITDLIMAKATENSSASIGGTQVAHTSAPGQAAGALNTKIQAQFTEHVVPGLTTTLHNAMGELSRQLELARRDAVSTKANTMEWYLGRLPYVQATLFYNLFFPFWAALLRCLVGAADGPAATALKSVLDGADKMNSAAEEANPVSGAMDEVSSGMKSANSALTEASAAQQEFKRDTGISTPVGVPGGAGGMSVERVTNVNTNLIESRVNQASLIPALPVVRGKFKLPFTSRVADGQGMEIDDYDDVKTHHQWENAIDPNAKPAEDDSGGGNSAANSSPASAVKSLLGKK